LYVIHPFMERFVPWAYQLLGATQPVPRLAHVPALTAATILIAAASWQLYERPLNDLKRYFSYA
jgi:peptidoglycan/LPS O-acetylase OafA/YrhL